MNRGPLAMLSGMIPELKMGLSSLFVHKLRSLLTMLGMIFGVGAVVAMLSITAGAQKEMMSYIDLLGVNNIIIEAKEAVDRNELQARRAISPGLTFRDYRAIAENVPGIDSSTPRKRFKPLKVLPKTAQEAPLLIGVTPDYLRINSLKMVEGRFFSDGRRPAVGSGLRAGRIRQGQSARLRSGGRQVCQDERHVAAGDRGTRAAGGSAIPTWKVSKSSTATTS